MTSCRSNGREQTILSRLHIFPFIYDSFFPSQRRSSSLLYSVQWVSFFRTHVIALLRFNRVQTKISCWFLSFENAVPGRFTDFTLILSKRSMFLTTCSGLNFNDIFTVIYTFTLWFCWNLVCFFDDEVFDININVFRPDMTYKIGWGLKANYLLLSNE